MMKGYAFKPNQRQQQKQHVALTPRLQQSLRLLQLSSAEVSSLIIEEAENNPLLDISWNDQQGPSAFRVSGRFDKERDWDRIANIQGESESLEQFLLSQIRMSNVQGKTLDILKYLAGNLDEKGYLNIGLPEVCSRLNISAADAEAALALLQTLEPAGVGARDLSECLLIQIGQDPSPRIKAKRIVQNYLEYLANGRVKRIAKELACDEQEVYEAVRYIRGLDPRPGARFARAEQTSIVPDASLIKELDGSYTIVMTRAQWPSVAINREYSSMLQQNAGRSADDFLREKLQAAKELMQNMEYRNETLYRLIDCIVREQHEFLERGVHFLRPLTLKDIAAKLKISESTVSRAVRNKYVSTPQGTYELKYFFSSGLPAADEENTSSKGIKARIRQLILEEDKSKPLSDQQIAVLLAGEGIQLSRRTVMKYREEMRLLSSRQRFSV